VTRPGGHLLLEFYNRHSLRYLVKSLKPPTHTSGRFVDEDVFTRFDSLETIRSYLPPSLRLERVRGIRIFTPVARAHDIPAVGPLLGAAERASADLPGLRRLGGFLVAVARRR